VAIDWSGSATVAGQRRHIVVASSKRGEVTLQSGFTREEVAELLIAEAGKNPRLVVGLDFAFAFPAWWVRAQGCADVFSLWALTAREGEQWLRECRGPFWGRPGRGRPRDHEAPSWLGFRRADLDCPIRPKSPFQIGGAGAVGTGSIRGMPMLARLHQRGFHIWPFAAPALPLVLEIYPRLFTGAVVKSDVQARTTYLRRPRFAGLPQGVLATAAASEDAFDALCSVLGMVDHAQRLQDLAIGACADQLLEGAIWGP